jgi:hypothetical protein
MLIYSDFIKDLLDLPSDQSIDQAPIHVHQPANIVRKFIDCAISSQDHDFKLSFVDIKAFVDLCDHLQCLAIKLSVLKSLKIQMANINLKQTFDAWEIFKVAANQGDVALAKLAIGHFERSGIVRDLFAKQSATFFDDVPPRYVYALLRCFTDPTLAIVKCPILGDSRQAIVFRPAHQAAAAFSL